MMAPILLFYLLYSEPLSSFLHSVARNWCLEILLEIYVGGVLHCIYVGGVLNVQCPIREALIPVEVVGVVRIKYLDLAAGLFLKQLEQLFLIIGHIVNLFGGFRGRAHCRVNEHLRLDLVIDVFPTRISTCQSFVFIETRKIISEL